MKSSGDEAAHLFEVVNLQQIFHTAIHTEVVEGLADVCSVGLVVVGDSLVAHGQLPDEIDEVAELKLIVCDKIMPG